MNSVIKGASYILAHTPDMVMENGTTQTTEKIVNPGSEYLKELPNHIRTYEQALAYLPNQGLHRQYASRRTGQIPTAMGRHHR